MGRTAARKLQIADYTVLYPHLFATGSTIDCALSFIDASNKRIAAMEAEASQAPGRKAA